MRTTRPKKRLSQCFLVDDAIAEEIAEVVDLDEKEVLEIGAGTGQLTAFLAARAKRVIAIEIDKDLIPKLEELLAAQPNIEIVKADALQTDLGGYDVVFGNIPYHISSPLLVKLFNSRFKKAVFLMQKELAERLGAAAGTKEYSRLSVLAQNTSKIKIVDEVPASAFDPVPQVDSAIVLIERKPSSQVKEINEQLVALLFQHKNQFIHNALVHSATALEQEKAEVKKVAQQLPHSEKRVKELTLADLEDISRAWKKLGK